MTQHTTQGTIWEELQGSRFTQAGGEPRESEEQHTRALTGVRMESTQAKVVRGGHCSVFISAHRQTTARRGSCERTRRITGIHLVP